MFEADPGLRPSTLAPLMDFMRVCFQGAVPAARAATGVAHAAAAVLIHHTTPARAAWIVTYVVVLWFADVHLDAAPALIVCTALYLIFTVGLRDGEDDTNTLSAYSVFNRGMERMLGEVDAAELARQYAGGGFAAAVVARPEDVLERRGFEEDEEEEPPPRQEGRRDGGVRLNAKKRRARARRAERDVDGQDNDIIGAEDDDGSWEEWHDDALGERGDEGEWEEWPEEAMANGG